MHIGVGCREVRFRLPLDGPVTVAWGGADTDVNYHAVMPDQRWAYDLLVTREGRTHRGDGTRLDDYPGLTWDDVEGPLRERLATTTTQPFYVVVEKILGHDETLPDDWVTDGTTGYECLNVLNGLFVDPGREEAITRVYQAFTGTYYFFGAIPVAASMPGLSRASVATLMIIRVVLLSSGTVQAHGVPSRRGRLARPTCWVMILNTQKAISAATACPSESRCRILGTDSGSARSSGTSSSGGISSWCVTHE